MSEDPVPFLVELPPRVEPGRDEIRAFRVDLSAGPEGDDFRRSPEWSLLDPEERARAERLVRARDGRRFVRCRGALRTLLGGLSGVDPIAVTFRAGPGGKPLLIDPDGSRSSWRFNVTHSADLALIAASREWELGVDLEWIRPIEQAARIVESYFTAAEVAEFLKLAEGDRAEAFVRGWTRKEAVVKARGVGLAGLALEFETHFGEAPPLGSFRPCQPLPEVLGWRLWETAPAPGFVATLAVGPRVEIRVDGLCGS